MMKKFLYFCMIITMMYHQTYCRYPGPRQQRTDVVQTIMVHNKTPYFLYVYFKPYVQLNRCDNDHVCNKIVRFGYAIKPQEIKKICLDCVNMSSSDVHETTIDLTGMVYGAVIACNPTSRKRLKEYITIKDKAMYVASMQNGRLKITNVVE